MVALESYTPALSGPRQTARSPERARDQCPRRLEVAEQEHVGHGAVEHELPLPGPLEVLVCVGCEHEVGPAQDDRAQTLVARLLGEASGRALAGPFEGVDTTAAEIALMRRAFAPHLQRTGRELATRADIDALVRSLLRRGL
jgi:hypothetical protein